MATNSTITLSDAAAWTKGAYLAYLAPWGAGSLVQGKDYIDTLTLSGDLFPNSVTMSWRWPSTAPTASGVYNFNAIDFGNYNNTNVQTPITALQVKSIGTLNQTHSLKLGGDATKYDVITDFFLTAKAGDHSTKLFEVEVFLHTPAFSKAYVQHATGVGTYTDAQGRAWTVALDKFSGLAPNILLMPKDAGDVLKGSVDIKGMLDWLTTKGVITGNEYFNGLGMGAEVQQGSGSLVIDTFSVDYGAKTLTAVPVVAPSATTNALPVIDSNGGGASAALGVLTGTKAVTTVHATDADGTAPVYAIKGGADAALFTIDAKTGLLAFKDAPSYAAPKDAGGDNVYDVTVRASDGAGSDDQALTVSVANAGTSAVMKAALGGTVDTSSKTLSLVSEHYDANWKMTRTIETEVVRFDGAKEIVEQRTAAGKLAGAQITSSVDGKEMVQHFDAKWAFSGAEVTTYGVQTVTDHYDAAWKVAGHDVFAFDNGKAIEQHYDANWAFTGADVATTGAGKRTVDHYDAGWKLTGHDNVYTTGDKLTTQHYDANWKFVSADTATLATTQALNHDTLKAWLMA